MPEEGAEAAALERDAGRERVGVHALDAGERVQEPLEVLAARRREREPAVAGDDGGDAVPRRRRRGRLEHQLRVVVRVDVDEAGREHEPVGFEHGGRRVAGDAADAPDAPVAHLHVGDRRRATRAVDDPSPPDQQVSWHAVAPLIAHVPSLRSAARRAPRDRGRQRGDTGLHGTDP